MKFLWIISLLIVTGCSQHQVYDAIQQNQCLKKTGKIYCEDKTEYDDYKKQREKLIKEKAK